MKIKQPKYKLGDIIVFLPSEYRVEDEVEYIQGKVIQASYQDPKVGDEKEKYWLYHVEYISEKEIDTNNDENTELITLYDWAVEDNILYKLN